MELVGQHKKTVIPKTPFANYIMLMREKVPSLPDLTTFLDAGEPGDGNKVMLLSESKVTGKCTQILASLSRGFQCRPCRVLSQQQAEPDQRNHPTAECERESTILNVSSFLQLIREETV